MIKDEAQRSPKSVRKMLHSTKKKQDRPKVEEELFKKTDAKSLEEDARILKVIESYCTSAKGKGHISVDPPIHHILSSQEPRDSYGHSIRFRNANPNVMSDYEDYSLIFPGGTVTCCSALQYLKKF